MRHPSDARAPLLIPPGWSAAWLPAGAAGLLMLAIHGGLAISVALELVPSAWPHVDGSASVSRACRGEPAVHLFRALTLPAATLVALTWPVAGAWCTRALSAPRAGRWIAALGLVGALFLVLYATFLGTDGAIYRSLRRWGVYVFFGGTAVAQLVLTVVLHRCRNGLPALEPRVLLLARACCAFFLLAGPLNLLAAKVWNKTQVANVLEWWFALAMALHFALLARVWQRSQLRLEIGGLAPTVERR